MMLRAFGGVAVMVLIVGMASSVAAADGAAVFKAQCAKCHGETGQSDTSIGKAMKVPPLAGDAKVQKMTDADIAAVIKGNAKHPPTVKGLSEDEIKAAAAFVKEIAGK